jgi:sensor histidine kinase regulating citrate/malate metabolism
MNLRTKITALTTAIAVSVGLLIIVSIRGEIINAFRGELEKRAVSIAGNLTDRIANHILLKDYFQTTKALNEVMLKEADVEYIFVTNEEGQVIAHTFSNGTPPDITEWNQLDNRERNIQLLDTEKGYIRDIGISIFRETNSELHLGIREDSVNITRTRVRNITVPIVILVILLGIIATSRCRR